MCNYIMGDNMDEMTDGEKCERVKKKRDRFNRIYNDQTPVLMHLE